MTGPRRRWQQRTIFPHDDSNDDSKRLLSRPPAARRRDRPQRLVRPTLSDRRRARWPRGLSRGHARWAARTLGHRLGLVRNRAGAPGRRRRDRAHSRRRVRNREPGARLRRRRHHRADDQHPSGCARLCLVREIPADRGRSWGPHRVTTLANIQDQKVYLRDANDLTVTFAMIETRTALDNVEAIAATPGIDALFLGPADLSIALSKGANVD